MLLRMIHSLMLSERVAIINLIERLAGKKMECHIYRNANVNILSEALERNKNKNFMIWGYFKKFLY